MNEIKCSACNLEKKCEHFHKCEKCKSGYYNVCKNCRKIKSKIEYQVNKNLTKIILTGKTCSFCQIHKEISEFHRHIGDKTGYRSKCKKCRSEEFREKYKECETFSIYHKLRTKSYRVNNSKKINEYFRKRYVEKNYIYAWRGMLSSMLRRFDTKKENTTYDILGYSALDLKKHMEKLFVNGMTWNNWGEWHIDHIIPISFFEKTDDPKIINSLENLQPLWKSENIRKSNKIDGGGD